MRTMAWLVLCLPAFGAQEIADETEYRERMHDIDHSFATLSDRGARDYSRIEAEAAKLAELFGEVEAFWKGRGDEEAAGYARLAKDGADEARIAAMRKEEKGLEAAVETIARSCEGCHREPLDKYRIPREQGAER